MKKFHRAVKRVCRCLGMGRLVGDPVIKPIPGYHSSVIDSEGCEFGFEMYYHIPYAYHLHQLGKLSQTISCRDTKCFYWFSANHIEKYKTRRYIPVLNGVNQKCYTPPDFERWNVPDFQTKFQNRVNFGFDRPLLLIFNKYNSEFDLSPINFYSKAVLIELADRFRTCFQIVYLRPTSKIVHDHSKIFDLDEKAELESRGVVLAEKLHEQFPQLSFNEFQLCLLAQAENRFVVQGGTSYLNALFPGNLFVLHKLGRELELGTYEDFKRMNATKVNVADNEAALLAAFMQQLTDHGIHATAA